MDYNKLNKYLGWGVFFIALITYMLTLEETVSLWDCGEYIATSNKLEVGHPPGAPLFMMINRLVSAFAGPESVAWCVNAVSAVCSAFTILFLFWTITFIGRKLALSDFTIASLGTNAKSSVLDSVEKTKKTITDGQAWAILGSGLIGSLVYTFSDSFWFSAVEAEVYAMSSFFTALVFWAIFKWESVADEKKSDRWLVFIMFMIGLSIGVHLLNLLAIPAMAYVYYFKKFKKTTLLGFLLTGVIGLVGLLLIQNFIIPSTISIAAWFELFFTNSLGMPFNSGTIFFFLFLAGSIAFGLMYTRKNNYVNFNTGLLSLAVLFIGYSCFAMIPIRSNADLPIDENNPENLVALHRYLQREQYGDWPLLSGTSWHAETTPGARNPGDQWADRSDVYVRSYVVEKGGEDVIGFHVSELAEAEAYVKENGGEIIEKYYLSEERKNQKPTYKSEFKIFFPRMYSSNGSHITQYKNWSGYTTEGKDPLTDSETGKVFKNRNGDPVYLPSFGENMTYFGRYQINHMYWRYFMWNFAGRQNDDHNQYGDILLGNWKSGVGFIDAERLGDQSKLSDVRKNAPANNSFYFLPLILGLIGFIFHLAKAPKDWFVVLLLFLFTGFMIVIFLNQKPLEPRERDYAYAGSFYVFAIWVGLGVYALYEALATMKLKDLAIPSAVTFGLGLVRYIAETVSENNHSVSYSIFFMSVIAIGVLAALTFLKNLKENGKAAAGLVTGIALIAPIVMAVGGWDDHDRSNRQTAREMAKNYLKPCANQAIIFTNGDNDTFPLWYIQDVEGFRTDVRTVNLSLFNTDWYVEQMTRRAWDSDPLPISYKEHQYRSGGLSDQVFLLEGILNQYYGYMNSILSEAAGQGVASPKPAGIDGAMVEACKYAPEDVEMIIGRIRADFAKYGPQLGITTGAPIDITILQALNENKAHGNQPMPLKVAMDYVKSGNYTIDLGGGQFLAYIPAKKFRIPVDKQAVLAREDSLRKADAINDLMIPEGRESEILDNIDWEIGKSYIIKNNLMILDLIAHSDWERPIYFAATGGRDTYMGLENFLQMEGLVYRLAPLRNRGNGGYLYGGINSEKMYRMLVEEFDWGNLHGDINVDYYTRRPISNFRIQYLALAKALNDEGKFEKAQNALNKCLEVFPDKNIPNEPRVMYSFIDEYLANANGLSEIGAMDLSDAAVEKAKALAEDLTNKIAQEIEFFTSLRRDLMLETAPTGVTKEMETNISILQQILQSYGKFVSQIYTVNELKDFGIYEDFIQEQSIVKTERLELMMGNNSSKLSNESKQAMANLYKHLIDQTFKVTHQAFAKIEKDLAEASEAEDDGYLLSASLRKEDPKKQPTNFIPFADNQFRRVMFNVSQLLQEKGVDLIRTPISAVPADVLKEIQVISENSIGKYNMIGKKLVYSYFKPLMPYYGKYANDLNGLMNLGAQEQQQVIEAIRLCKMYKLVYQEN